MKKQFIVTLLSVAMAGSALLALPAAASASSLTPTQVQAILGLLVSFGADQATINNVSASLGATAPTAQTTTGTPAQTTSTHVCADFTKLKRGDTDSSTGGQVSTLQKFLKVSVAGIYGPATQAAWKRVCVGY